MLCYYKKVFERMLCFIGYALSCLAFSIDQSSGIGNSVSYCGIGYF